MDEEEIKRKADEGARRIVDAVNRLAEMCAEHFEEWALKHQSSTKDEAHKQLVSCARSAIITSNLIFGSVMNC